VAWKYNWLTNHNRGRFGLFHIFALTFLAVPIGCLSSHGLPHQSREPALSSSGSRVVARLGSSFLVHGGPVRSIAFSSDGTLLASAGQDRLVRIWDIRSRALLQLMQGHTEVLHAVAFSPNNELVASAGGDRVIRIWQTSTGKLIRRLPGHEGQVYALAFAAHAPLLASGGGDNQVRVWDLSTSTQVAALKGHEGNVYSVCLSEDGSTVCSASYDTTVRIWETKSGRCITTLKDARSCVSAVALSADGASVAAAFGNGKIVKWSATKSNLELSWDAHEGGVNCLAFAKQGELLSGGEDGFVKSWDASNGVLLGSVKTRLVPVHCIAFSKNGKQFAGGGGGRRIQLWDYDTFTEMPIVPGHAGSVTSLAIVSGDLRLFSGGHDGRIIEWQSDGPELIRAWQAHLGGVSGLSSSPSGRTLVSCGRDDTLRFWDSATGRGIKSIALSSSASCVDWASDGSVVIVATRDGVIRAIDAEKYVQVFQVMVRGEEVEAIACSPISRVFASGGARGILRTWDLTSGKLMFEVQAHDGGIHSISYPKEGDVLATAGNDGTINLLACSTGQILHSIRAHRDGAYAVAFSQDSRLLISGGWDKAVRLWEIASGKQLFELEGHQDGVSCVRFGGKPTVVFSGSADTTLIKWSLVPIPPMRGSPWKTLNELWTDLANDDAGIAHKAILAFASMGPDSCRFLLSMLTTSSIDDKVEPLIDSLDHDQATERENAERELMLVDCEIRLRSRLQLNPSPESRLRIVRLLASIDGCVIPHKETLRRLRAVQALEWAENDNAKQTLRSITTDSPWNSVRRHATLALKRLNQQERLKR